MLISIYTDVIRPNHSDIEIFKHADDMAVVGLLNDDMALVGLLNYKTDHYFL